jgi:hypothetical protein
MSHQSLTHRVEPLRIRNGRITIGGLGHHGRRTYGRLLGNGLLSRLDFAYRLLRRRLRMLNFRNNRLYHGGSYRFLDGEQSFKRRGRVGIDRRARLLERFDVAADQDAPGRRIHALVEHRYDAAT